MPSIFRYYLDRAEPYSCQGKTDELIVVTRKGKRESSTVMNNDKQAMFQDDTALSIGDLITNKVSGVQYFVVAKQSSNEATKAQLKLVNATIDIVRITQHMTGRVQDYDYEAPLFTAVATFYEDITGRMQQYDAGLNSTSTRRFLTTMMDIELLDRIKFNGYPMQVDVINTTTYQGFLSIQCRPDIRTTQAVA